MKVTWVEKEEITDWDAASDEALTEFEKNLGEWESESEVLGKLIDRAIAESEMEETITDEEIAASIPDDYVVKMPPVEEYTQKAVIKSVGKAELPEVTIDITLVGTLLRRSVKNTTENVWRKCYPGAFWIRDGQRLADPTTKGQCLGDIRPGLTYPFVVVVPIFPSDGKPDKLVVAILEDGVGWHTVEELRVR